MKMQAEEVPMSVVASFREIQELIDRSLLPAALSTSTELVVSDDGKMVRRRVLFSDVAAEEVQSRTIIAEKLPDDHHYQNLMRIFSAAGSVKSIRTCYPQGIDISGPAASKLSRIEMLFANQLHAFVEYETVEAAEKAVAEFNGGGNWRDGPRVCSMLGILKHGWVRGRESGEDEAADEDNPGTLQEYEAEDKAQGEKHDKIIAVCAVDPEYCHTRDTSEISRFFEDRKNDNKEVAVNGFLGAKYAIKAIKYSVDLSRVMWSDCKLY